MVETFSGEVDINKPGTSSNKATTIRLIGGPNIPKVGQPKGPHGQIWIGGNGSDGQLFCFPSSVNPKPLIAMKSYTIRLSASEDNVSGGGIVMYDGNKKEAIKLAASPGEGNNSISVRENLVNNKSKNIFACSYTKGTRDTPGYAGIYIGAHSSEQKGGKPGYIAVRDMKGNDSITINGNWGGGRNSIAVSDGSKNIFACSFDEQTSRAGLYVGTHSTEGSGNSGIIALRDKSGNDSIFLDGEKGDIFLSNADCAEEFDISSSESSSIEPGTVMIIDNDGKLERSSKPYDKRVAGVISGAGDCKPAIVLDKKISKKKRMPVALVGKVYCKVDADYARINIGDMLSTSSTPGYAMKASNRSKAFGAVIGKALHALRNGKSLIPILIALQ
jgi:hypothetical protein